MASYAHVTKNALARSLKKLMLTKPLHKITIQELTADCGVTRHTFYNHFQDIYELLGWVYQIEVIEGLEQYRSFSQWEQGFLSVLNYTQTNKTICLNTFNSLGREHLDNFLYGVIYHMIISIVNELAEECTACRVSTEDRKIIADFYSLAVLEQVIQWLKSGANTDPIEIVRKVSKLMDGNIVGAIEKYKVTS